MKQDKLNIKKGCVIVLVVYIVCVVLFCTIAQDQMKYSGDYETICGASGGQNLGPLLSTDRYIQTLSVKGEYITSAEIYFMTYSRENTGTVTVSLKDMETDQIYSEVKIDISELNDSAWQMVDFDGYYDVSQMKQPAIEIFTDSTSENNAITIGWQENANVAGQSVYKNGEEWAQAGLSIHVFSTSASPFYKWYIPGFVVLFFLLSLYCILLIRNNNSGKRMFGLKLIYTFQKYRFLMNQLISRDFKTKYKRSVLGILWSFLNPLLMMLVQYVVFSNLFRFNIPNYAVYLLTGIVLYSGFSEMTTNAMSSITGNAALITKVYVPKYIYPLSKVLSTAINTLLSLIPLLLVAVFTGVKLTPALVFLPFGIVCFILFIIGISLALSSFMVFFRDMQFLWGVFTTMWMYATPIMYPIDILPNWLLTFEKFNPLYLYILFLRTIVIDGVSPAPTQYLLCLLWALGALLVGGFIFKKTQDRFVLYI